MLSRLRKIVSTHVEEIAMVLAKVGLSPNAVTFLGLALSFLCVAGALLRHIPMVFVFLLLSSAMDVLDGALARALKRVTKFGSILDSFSDRVEESMYLLALNLLGLPNVIILISLTISFLISYLRALGEKHDLKMEGVGILERGERIVIISIVVITLWLRYLLLAKILMIVLIVLGCITILQRLLYIYRYTLG